MTRKSIKKMNGSLVILLVHVIKVVVERKVTPSWNGSIYARLVSIKKYNINKNNSYTIKPNTWFELIQDCLEDSLDIPAWECCDGFYEGNTKRLLGDLDIQAVYHIAEELLKLTYSSAIDKEKITHILEQYLINS